MATLISVHNLKKAFGARPLFDGLTFSIETGERIGLIGPNGAGKSTLLKLLASRLSPDSGNLAIQRGLRVGFLEQVPSFKEGASILDTVLEGTEDPHDWQNVALAQELVSKLSLNLGEMTEQSPVSKLSGGWKKRVALARELARRPDLLLLDEPTNHLDVESILWLERLLARSAFATMTITHDRLFLQRVANRIIELDPRHSGGLLSVAGDYSAFIEARELLISAQERREVILKNTLRRETEWLRQGAKARTTKQQARIQRAGELKDEVGELVQRNQSRAVKLEFQSAERSPRKLIEARGIAKSYSGRQIFSDFGVILSPGTRLGLLGPNGCGKSTLIRVLLGLEPADKGDVLRAENLTVSYFDQTRETLDPELSVMKTLCPTGDFVTYQGNRIHIRSYLDRFLFSRDQAEMSVGKLSGGEQSRLLLARLMLNEANLLVLDEPTNDLDLATLNVLEECLTEFPGAVILVTHDRYFLDQVATRIVAFDSSDQRGKLVPFADLFQWENWYRECEEKAAAAAKSKGTGAGVSNAADSVTSGEPKKKKRLGFKEQRELDSMESNIHEAEERLSRLTTESLLPENLSNSTRLTELTREMATTQSEIDRLYRRWAELES